MDEFKPNKKKLNILGTTDLPTERPKYATKQLVKPEVAVKPSYEKPAKRLLLSYGTAIILTLIIPVGIWKYQNTKQKNAPVTMSLIPAAVTKSVNYKIYYPEQSKLPSGYTFNQDSISSPVKNGVAYSVNYHENKKIVFSLQPKPSDSELQSFKSNYIPLRNEVLTKLGRADIGAYNQQTLVSLPLNEGPWIVVTAPSDINQDELKQVLNSLTL